MKTISMLIVVLCLSYQSEEFEFFLNGKWYSFTLPKTGYVQTDKSYTEGVYYTFQYEDGSTIILHAGYNVLKPILNKKDYKVLKTFSVNEMDIRCGYHKKTKLYWQENTTGDEGVTLLFKNVSKNNLKSFETSVNSLKIIKKIR